MAKARPKTTETRAYLPRPPIASPHAETPTARQLVGLDPTPPMGIWVPGGDGQLRAVNPGLLMGAYPGLCEGGMEHAWDAVAVEDGQVRERCKFCPAERLVDAPEGFAPDFAGHFDGRPPWMKDTVSAAATTQTITVRVQTTQGDDKKDVRDYYHEETVAGDFPPQALAQHLAGLLREIAKKVEHPDYRMSVDRLELGVDTFRGLGESA